MLNDAAARDRRPDGPGAPEWPEHERHPRKDEAERDLCARRGDHRRARVSEAGHLKAAAWHTETYRAVGVAVGGGGRGAVAFHPAVAARHQHPAVLAVQHGVTLERDHAPHHGQVRLVGRPGIDREA